MPGLAEVLEVERTTEEGVPVVDVKVDPGGGAVEQVGHFADPGEDSPPLPGDVAALADGAGTGVEQAVGYLDPKNAGKAAPGEKRTYARDDNGEVVAEIWQKGNGDIAITSLKSGGKVTINGVEIDQQGNIKAPGEVSAMAGTPATAVKLSTHLHPTAVGPTSPPTPGT